MDSRRVLAIALDWRMRRLLRVNLEVMGLQVCEAAGEHHGLQSIPDDRPDLILVDLDEMDTDAREYIRTVRDRLAGRPVPILVLSAEPSDRYLVEPGLASGYVRKPFAAWRLLDRVAHALGDAPAEA